MTTLTVQAEDTATAMEQIADQLGPDADPVHNKAMAKSSCASNDSSMRWQKGGKSRRTEFSHYLQQPGQETGPPKLARKG